MSGISNEGRARGLEEHLREALGATGPAPTAFEVGPPAPTNPGLRSPELQDPTFAAIQARDREPLAIGARGPAVKKLQEALIALGHLPAGSDDGVFGRGGERALAAFQRAKGLDPTGRLDGWTLFALDRALLTRAAEARIDAEVAARAAAAAAAEAEAAAADRAVPASLTDPAEREAFAFVADKLFLGARAGRVDFAVSDEETVAVLGRLDQLRPKHYRNVLQALADTSGRSGGLRLLDTLIQKGTSGQWGARPSLSIPEALVRALFWAFRGKTVAGSTDLSVALYIQMRLKLMPLLATPESAIFPRLERLSVQNLMADVKRAGIK